MHKSPDIYYQTNLGYQPRNRASSQNETLQIGYFQHQHWSEDQKVIDQLNRLSLTLPSKRFKQISTELDGKKILVIHMRFGDYLNEKLFGVPTLKYFRDSLQIQTKSALFDKVVVFTNGELNALKMLDTLKLENVLVISDSERISASETLELMRFGSAYILSNSTFGWWGAFLSRHTSPKVICPTPWFQGMSEPRELIPNHWLRIQI
jgi:hypothetical protein